MFELLSELSGFIFGLLNSVNAIGTYFFSFIPGFDNSLFILSFGFLVLGGAVGIFFRLLSKK